ncbi:MAG: LysM domain protein [Chloroflexi bacterium ADurb.Bin222]|nr:MAG: LysM domain protein [Chloroflexi bacterium ADurb.Bin222]
MFKLTRVVIVIAALLLGAIILGRCHAAQKPESAVAPQPTETATPTAELVLEGEDLEALFLAAEAPVKIVVTAPSVVEIGQPPAVVQVQLLSAEPLGELRLELNTGVPQLEVVDADAETPGIQVTLAALPEGAAVPQLEVDAAGIVRLRLQNYPATGSNLQNLLLFQVQGVTAGVASIYVQNAEALAVDGVPLLVDWGEMALVQVQPAGAAEAPPVPSTSDSAAGGLAPGIYYRIRRGQNLFRLSRAFGVSVEAIMQTNGITDTRHVPAGRILHIPAPSPKGQAAYLVGPDETLYGIATALGVTVEQLAQQNAIAPPYLLQAGMYLLLRP